MCYLFGVGQVQINLRVSPEEFAAIELARGSRKRNAFLLDAVMARVEEVGPAAPVAPVPEPALSRPSARAPRGCRVVGVPAGLRDVADG